MRLRLPVALAIGLVLTGCSSSDDREGSDGQAAVSPPTAASTAPVEKVNALNLPIEVYLLTGQQQRLLNNATARLVNDCMARYGFSGEFLPAQSGDLSSGQLTRRYGVTDPAVAARYGYHLAPQDEVNTNAKPGTSRRYSKSELLVLTGSESGDVRPDQPPPTGKTYQGTPLPAGGCSGEARQRLGQDVLDAADPTRLVDEINIGMYQRTMSDQRVSAVFSKWSSCMKQKGYSFKNPKEPLEKADLRVSAPSPTEIQTAVTDVACQREHNVIGVWHGVESAYQKSAIQQNIERLTAIKNAQDDAIRKAAALLGVSVPQ